jgi:hypothetical protein
MTPDIDSEFESILNPTEDEKILAKKSQVLYNKIKMDIAMACRDYRTRVLIRMIFEDSGLYRMVAVAEENTLHAEGRRSVGQLLKARLDEIDPKLYHEIMIEGVDYERTVLE